MPSLNKFSQEDCRGHCQQHASRNGKAVNPRGILLFLDPDEDTHRRCAYQRNRQRKPAAGEAEQTVTGDIIAKVKLFKKLVILLFVKKNG